MQYEKQKAACAEYAQRNGGSVADVLRTNGHKGAVVLSKDGRTIYDPFVIEPIAEVIPAEAEPAQKVETPVEPEAGEKPAGAEPAPKKKAPARKKK